MSKEKTLLNENTIRRFMKLADMGGLQENYFDKYEDIQEAEYGRDDDDLGVGGDDLGELGELGGEETPEEVEDIDVVPTEAGVEEGDLKSIINTITSALEAEYGIPITVESEPAAEAEVDVEVEDEGDLGGLGDVGVEGEEGEEGEDTTDLMELLSDADIQVVDNEPIVQEVLKRVAKRLIRHKIKSS